MNLHINMINMIHMKSMILIKIQKVQKKFLNKKLGRIAKTIPPVVMNLFIHKALIKKEKLSQLG